ncbi:MAG: lytic transglycosylase domain-containing protein [Candidatus Kapaibacterium sp.]
MKSLITAIVFFLIACSPDSDGQQSQAPVARMQQHEIPKNFNNYISTLRLPDRLELCGEEIPLDIPEVRQRAEREFYLLLQQPGQIMLYLKRSGRYFPMFERVIRENNMPEDIKFLAVAESALYQAISSAGAIGLWQFMKDTGRKMGLRIDYYVDERRHPEKSARAAMKYLRQGYAGSKSWILTLAGYNMGHTGVKRRLAHQSADDYFDLYLNEETSRFIFRIALIKEFMTNPAKYGFVVDPADLYTEPNVRKVVVRTNIKDLADWAIKQGTSYKYVRMLNPWILGKSLPWPRKGETWEIDLPAEGASHPFGKLD